MPYRFKLAKLYDTNGIPFWLVFSKTTFIDWIYEYNYALWHGWTHELFMKKLKDGLQFIPQKENILMRINKYIESRDNATEYNIYILKESK